MFKTSKIGTIKKELNTTKSELIKNNPSVNKR